MLKYFATPIIVLFFIIILEGHLICAITFQNYPNLPILPLHHIVLIDFNGNA